MISETTIDQVKAATDIVQVVGSFVSLSKQGSSYQACCPFHNERTPSFRVNTTKGFFKCFGCGKSGDAISFVREHEKLDYPQAIEWLAKFYNITIEQTKDSRTPEEIEQRTLMLQVNELALDTYCSQLIINQEAQEAFNNRQLSNDTIAYWQLGYAPANWRTLSDQILAHAKETGQAVYKAAETLGIVKAQNGKAHDVWYDRLMFPIRNEKGVLCGFGGRALTDEGAKFGKYINSADSPLYNKSKLLYGLYQCLQAKAPRTKVYLVEGYFDVIQMHQSGICNTVAPCGTALAPEQIIVLKKFTKHIVLFIDADSAGINSAVKNINVLLAHDFKVSVAIPPDGHDPDSYIRLITEGLAELNVEDELHEAAKLTATVQKCLDTITQDAILWKAEHLYGDRAAGAYEKSDSVSKIAELLSNINSDVIRDVYIEELAKKKYAKSTTLKKLTNQYIEDRDGDKDLQLAEGITLKLPAGVKPEEFFEDGFYGLDTPGEAGYYFPTDASNTCKRMSNFVIKPLFQIYHKTDGKRLIEINNGIHKVILDAPSNALISLDQFNAIVFGEGNFLFYGTKGHLMKVIGKIGKAFPLCYELKILGWQPEGFFAYSNAIYSTTGGLIPMDNMGIVPHGDKMYFSASASDVYRNVRKEDDEYTNDRFLIYALPIIKFSEWAKLIVQTYPDEHAGHIGIAYVFVATFKDVVFKMDNNCPHLSGYGMKGTGKSKWAESLTAPFLNNLQPFNLNHGTEFAFFNRLSRFRNCLTWFDEFDDSSIKEDRFQSIKGAYDGAGRERGKGGSKSKTEIAHINSALVLTGQYLSTRDDNAALTRCIIVAFRNMEDKPRTAEQLEAYTHLKQLEKENLCGLLTELLQYRHDIENEYAVAFAQVFTIMRQELGTRPFLERILRNYTSMVTMVKLLENRLQLPFTYENFRKQMVSEVLKLSQLQSESDSLSNFWKTVVYLVETGQIINGFHYKIETTSEVTVYRNGKDDKIKMDGPRRVLFIRLPTIHALYSSAYRSQHGRNGIDEQSLKLYLTQSQAYIGTNNSSRFSNHAYIKARRLDEQVSTTITSSLVMYYDTLNQRGLNLETVSDGIDHKAEAEQALQESKELQLEKQSDMPF